jgi:hypothetical protein
MTPQSGLNNDNVVGKNCTCTSTDTYRALTNPVPLVSIILPSGVAKLRTIGCDTSGFSADDKNAVTGIFGISGTLTPSDYAYTTVANIKAGLVDWKERPPTPGDEEGTLRLALINGVGDTVPMSLPLIR